jgi:hypothetical protein
VVFALRAAEARFVKAIIVAVFAGAAGQVLANVTVHVDLENPVADLVTVILAHHVLFRKGNVVRKGNVSAFEVSVISNRVVFGVLNRVVKINVSVQEDERHVVLVNLFVRLTSIKEGFIGTNILAVAEKTSAKLGRDTVETIALSLSLQKKEMSHHEVFHEFNENRIGFVSNHLFQVFNELLEHFSQDLKLNFIYCSKNFNSNCLVDGKHLLDCGCVVAGKDTGSFLKLSLLQESFGELHKVSVNKVLALLLSKAEALFPLSTTCEHLKSRHITSLNKLVNLSIVDVHSFFVLGNFLNHHVLHFCGTHILSTLHGAIKLFALDESFNSLFKETNSFVELAS